MKGLYKHYKGGLYEVVGIARHSETLEDMVVYKASGAPEGGAMWVRPLSMFLETVVLDGVGRPRFEKLS